MKFSVCCAGQQLYPEGSTGQIQVKLDNSEWIQLDVWLLERFSPSAPQYQNSSLKMPECTEVISKGTEIVSFVGMFQQWVTFATCLGYENINNIKPITVSPQNIVCAERNGVKPKVCVGKRTIPTSSSFLWMDIKYLGEINKKMSCHDYGNQNEIG